MAGQPLINSGATKEKLRAPVWWFADVAVPSSGTVVTLAAESGGSGWKTPDATENPNAICIGCTDDFDINGEQAYDKDYCQQFAAPIGVFAGDLTMSVELPIVGAINSALMAKLHSATVTTVSSTTLIQGGSLDVLPSMAILGVFKMQNDPTKFGYILFLNCNQVMAWNAKGVSRKKFARSSVKFEALTLSGRAPGKDVYEVALVAA